MRLQFGSAEMLMIINNDDMNWVSVNPNDVDDRATMIPGRSLPYIPLPSVVDGCWVPSRWCRRDDSG